MLSVTHLILIQFQTLVYKCHPVREFCGVFQFWIEAEITEE